MVPRNTIRRNIIDYGRASLRRVPTWAPGPRPLCAQRAESGAGAAHLGVTAFLVRIGEVQHAFSAQKGVRQVFDLALDAALQHALHKTFFAMFVISILIVLLSVGVPVVKISNLNLAEDERDVAE
jgi:hypothetical protein